MLGHAAIRQNRLTLRSIAQRCVSKGGQPALSSPPFETRQSAGFTPRDAGAPQGEVVWFNLFGV